MTTMSVEEFAQGVLFGISVCLLLLFLVGCQPVQELRSPCHVAASADTSDCDFTPINQGAV